jgi:hypothetical protein
MLKSFLEYLSFITFFCFYQVSTIMWYIITIPNNFKQIRNDFFVWGKMCINIVGIKLFLINNSNPLHIDSNMRGIYLLNHRDIYDFPIDCYMTSGSAMFISRYINMFAFPLQCIGTYFIKSVFYFKRDSIKDKNIFNESIYNRLCNTNYRSINIYPEGTRRYDNNCITLKKGSMHIAWKYKMFIQIIITRNKERIIMLKTLKGHYGTNLYCYRSKPIYPSDFNNFDNFNEYVNKIWQESWDIVYSQDESKLIVEPFEMKPYLINLSKWEYIKYSLVHSIIIGSFLYLYFGLQIF